MQPHIEVSRLAVREFVTARVDRLAEAIQQRRDEQCLLDFDDEIKAMTRDWRPADTARFDVLAQQEILALRRQMISAAPAPSSSASDAQPVLVVLLAAILAVLLIMLFGS